MYDNTTPQDPRPHDPAGIGEARASELDELYTLFQEIRQDGLDRGEDGEDPVYNARLSSARYHYERKLVQARAALITAKADLRARYDQLAQAQGQLEAVYYDARYERLDTRAEALGKSIVERLEADVAQHELDYDLKECGRCQSWHARSRDCDPERLAEIGYTDWVEVADVNPYDQE